MQPCSSCSICDSRAYNCRYKHTLLIDVSHIKMGMVSSGSKRAALQKIFGIGSKYFPETIWKIYLINGPMVFRGVYACVKPFLAPETIAKINILGSYESAMKKMEQDGLPRSVLPEFMGGGAKGIASYDYVNQLVQVMICTSFPSERTCPYLCQSVGSCGTESKQMKSACTDLFVCHFFGL